MATGLVKPGQTPDNSILDLNGRQTYLGNAFVASIKSAALGVTTELPYALIINPAGNSKSMFNFLRRIMVVTQTAGVATFRFYIAPTITSNGTAVPIGNLRINPNAQATTMQMFSLPTVTANGTFIAEIGTTSSCIPYDSDLLSIIDPGVTLLVTAQASSSTVPAGFETAWYEL